ncbi:MAG: tRNA (guanosine(46)-N7)-methyltransferase TrmB [Planctomycetaceae bacterium]|jgi:tRNA (guanine-N7-)-methyltransferase|nr:tRNA (guanosine(46)-N7)-methyltransferase TrmB [Planctomycetaceae bacterium]
MGRRAVKTINQDLDLSQVLKTPEELPAIWSSEAIFGCSSPLELEIGSGKGLFLRRIADQFPERHFIGIEIGQKYARFSAARLYDRSNRNAVIVCGDAADILHDRIPDNILAAVHVYFPDPWWKRAHRKRRILRLEVLRLIERRLQPGGVFHFWTDVEEYFLSTLRLLRENFLLLGPFEVSEKEAEDDFDYRTHFERRTRLHGAKVYRVMFIKASVCD